MHRYSPTATNGRLEALKSRHSHASNAIRREGNRVNPDMFLLQELKRERLKLKDEIVGL